MQERVEIERRPPLQHVIDRTRQVVRQDGQGCALAMCFLQAGEPLLAGRLVPQEPHGGCGAGPLAGGMADLRSSGPVAVAGRGLGTFDQAAGGDKSLHPREPPAVMALIEPHETEELADPGHGPEQVQGIRTVLRGSSDEVSCQIAEELVGGAKQGEVDCDALLYSGIREPLGDAVSMGFVGNLFPDLG